uniref:PAXIP1-associated glutamate-rich protein 1 n=1 Tax=Glossina austeni TaxID=7395 RepID=A0A1A9UEI8_GLOAU
MTTEVTSSGDSCIKDGEDFMPSAEELENYYNILESGTILELEWQCPGRRSPSPDCASNTNKEQTKSTHTNKTQEPMKANDFDFSDDIAQPQMRVRSQNSTPKSAKKKTANFAGVMEVLKKKNAEDSS